MKIGHEPTEELVTYGNNAKIHASEQVEQIKRIWNWRNSDDFKEDYMKEQPRLINWQKPDGYIWEIYAIVNRVNHKTYIGQTKRGVNKRFLEHLKGNDQCSALNKAVNKYGADSFTVLKIDVARTQEEADEKERYWVSRYESTADKRGYNLTSGGGQFEFSSATKMHMSESRQGSKNSFFGKHHSEESKRKMSEKKKGDESAAPAKACFMC